jgi:hypothetical protein
MFATFTAAAGRCDFSKGYAIAFSGANNFDNVTAVMPGATQSVQLSRLFRFGYDHIGVYNPHAF